MDHQDTFECDVGNLHVNYIGWNLTKRTAQSLVDIDYILLLTADNFAQQAASSCLCLAETRARLIPGYVNSLDPRVWY
jgi:hypothetical protein